MKKIYYILILFLIFSHSAFAEKVFDDLLDAVPADQQKHLKSLYYTGQLQLLTEKMCKIKQPSVQSGKKGNVAMLTGYLPEYNSNTIKKLADALRKQKFGVTLLSAEQICDNKILSTNRFFAFIIPNAEVYPVKGYTALETFAKNGGHIVFAGGPAFKKPVWKVENKWQISDEIKTKYKIKNAHSCFDMNKPVSYYGWSRKSFKHDKKCVWEIVDDMPQKGMKSFHYLCKKFEGWDGFLTKKLDHPLYKKGYDLLCFRVRGDSGTPQIAVELQETDGSRWIATTPVNTNWQHVFLPVSSFKYWGASTAKLNRGGENDEMRPEKVCRISFGLSLSHTPSSASEAQHEFFVSEISTASDSVLSKVFSKAGKPPIFESISPSYKVYPLTDIEKIIPAAPWKLTNKKWGKPKHAISPIPRTHGRGFKRNQKWRQISLANALNSENKICGSLFWILLNNKKTPYENSCFVGLASSEPDFLNSEAITETLVETLDRLHNGLLFVEAGADNFSVFPEERVELGANILRFKKEPTNSFLRFTVKKSDGSLYLQKEFKINFAGRKNFITNLFINAPETEGEILTVDAAIFTNGKLTDKITHKLGVLREGLKNKNQFVKTKGNQFILNGKPWNPAAVNFWPAYVAGMEINDFFTGWLNRNFYAPEEIERDLTLMEDLGINMVSIQNFNSQTYPELLDFLRRCATHKIKVNLFLTTSSPLDFKEKEVRQYIENGKLASNPAIFAYDIIWEPGNSVFNKNNRHKWDKDWNKWIQDQYGSVVNAEKDWRISVPRDDNGKVISPPDKYFREDGKWRVMMAAYRRFMNNLMSKKWNNACSAIRKVDPNHLISFRQGNTLPHDFTFTATAKHIDFICPEGYSIKNNEDGYNAAGFITRFVHFTTGGKPILWAEFGKHVWDNNTMQPDEKLIKKQNIYFNLFYKMVLETGANGLAPWWWPGGYRVDEHSDYGIINPDRTLRLSAKTLKKFAPLIKAPRKWPKADEFLEIDLDEHAGGYWYLCFNKGKEAYRKARRKGKNLGIRTRGTGTTSVTTPLVAVGNRPYNGHNPLKYLDAEFNWFKILDINGNWINADNGAVIEVAAGKPVHARVSVGNTQEATWIPPSQTGGRKGGVVLASTEKSELTFTKPINQKVCYLGDADLGEFILCKMTDKKLKAEARMQAENRCAFGEISNFTLKTKK
jgi:hypothetical protein